MVSFLRRFFRIGITFLPFAVLYLRDRRRFLVLGASRTVAPEEHARRARRLREAMLDLGPTFVKIGQVLSTRPDIVPQVYADEFVMLQDSVPAGPHRDAISSLAADVGCDSYDDLDREPIAAGSLAQVYRATYRGESVAVKVRRPGIHDLVETDLRIIRRLVPVALALTPDRFAFSLQNIADDFERIILEELDFEREARLMDEIRSNFEADGDETVRIPRVHHEASSERVLTMEYVDGTKVTAVDELEASGHDPSRVAEAVANAYLTMGLEHGVYHGDPHPGNIAVDETGRIVLYDFGMCGRFTPAMRRSVVNLYLAAVNRDVDAITDELVELGALDPGADRADVGHVIQLLIEDLEGSETANWREIIDEAIGLLHDFPFRIPPDVMLAIRVGTISEGVLRELDPEFDILAASRAFLRERGFVERAARRKLEEVRSEFESALWALVRLPTKLERELDGREEDRVQRERLADRYQRRTSRSLGYAILAAGALVGSAVLVTRNGLYAAGGVLVALAFFALFVDSTR